MVSRRGASTFSAGGLDTCTGLERRNPPCSTFTRYQDTHYLFYRIGLQAGQLNSGLALSPIYACYAYDKRDCIDGTYCCITYELTCVYKLLIVC